MLPNAIGRILVITGLAIAVAGLILILLGRTSLFSQLGNLPGDIRIEGNGFTCLIPFTSMIIISIMLTVILNVIARLLTK